MICKTEEWIFLNRTKKQVTSYGDFYNRWTRLRWAFRYDVRYRCRRIMDIADDLNMNLENKRVLDVGFGTGHMLRQFPKSCALNGAEISSSAVENARCDRKYSAWKSSHFSLIQENAEDDLPRGPFDIVISSHTLEHVPDDREHLRGIYERLVPGGLLLLFVPIEEPNYNPDHLRNYSLDSVTSMVRDELFEIQHSEGSMHVTGHIWKLITIPSRRRTPVLKPLIDGFRLVTLSAIPYPLQLLLDRGLEALGVGPRQAFIVARKPPKGGHGELGKFCMG